MFWTGLLSNIMSLVLHTQSISISLADSQHNLYDKYLLLCIQY